MGIGALAENFGNGAAHGSEAEQGYAARGSGILRAGFGLVHWSLQSPVQHSPSRKWRLIFIIAAARSRKVRTQWQASGSNARLAKVLNAANDVRRDGNAPP